MKPGLTPAQQNLMDFLNKLASSPYSPQLMEEGNQALDAAVEETQQLQDNIHRVCNAMRSAQQTAKLDGVIN
jgi:hypothetical protein